MPQTRGAPDHPDFQHLVDEGVDGAIAGLVYLYLFLNLQDGFLARLMQYGEAGWLVFGMLAVMFISLFATVTVVLSLCVRAGKDSG